MASYKDIIILQDGVSRTLEDILARTEKVTKKTETLQKRLSNVGKGLKDFGKTWSLRVTAPILAAGTASFKFASDMTETLGKIDVVFGDNAEKVKKWAETSIKQMGLASQTALDSAALYGDMATGMGLSSEQAAKMATELTQLGADLASFKNISNDVAQTALKSIFTGETESLKNLGVVMTETNLQEFARQQGIRKTISKMKEQEKIMLRYNYVLSKTKNAQGDFSRTNMNAANQTRMLTESLKQIGVQLGQVITPVVTKMLQKINEWLVKFQGLDERTQKIIVVVGLLAAAIPPLAIALGTVATAFSVLAAHPLVLTIMGIVTGFALLYKWAEMIGEAFGRIVAYWDKIANAKGFTGKLGAFWNAMTGNTEELDRRQNQIQQTSAKAIPQQNQIQQTFIKNVEEPNPQQQTISNITKSQSTPVSQNTNNSMNMTFNTSAVVREEADIDKIGQTLVNKFSSAYNNMGSYTPVAY